MAEIVGLYAVTADESDTAQLVQRVDAAIRGGARTVQYRNKGASQALRLEQAAALAALCRRQGAQLIVNDWLDVALQVDADGCHVGRDDGAVAAARSALGPRRILGVSCYDSLALATAACAHGADYVAFGSLFASSNKPAAVRAPLALFAAARRAGVDCSLVGIGGIDLHNIDTLIDAGADAAAVIAALFLAPDAATIERNANALASRFSARHTLSERT